MLITCKIRTKKHLGKAFGCINPKFLEYEKEYQIIRVEKKKRENTYINVYVLKGYDGYFDARIFEWTCDGIIFSKDKPLKNERLNNITCLNLKNKKYKKKRRSGIIDESQCVSKSEDMFFVSIKKKNYVVIIKQS